MLLLCFGHTYPVISPSVSSCLQISPPPPPPPPPPRSWAGVHALFIGIVCVCATRAILCACVFAMFCMKMFVSLFVYFVRLNILLICIIMGICALYVFL